MVTGRTSRGIKLSHLNGIQRKNDSKIWVVVAHQAGAKIFSRVGKKMGTNLNLVSEVYPPATPESPARGNPNLVSPSRVSAFVKSLGEILRNARVSQKFQHLILVAEPKFMGRMKAALDSITSRSILSSVEKDYAHCTESEIAGRLSHLMS